MRSADIVGNPCKLSPTVKFPLGISEWCWFVIVYFKWYSFYKLKIMLFCYYYYYFCGSGVIIMVAVFFLRVPCHFFSFLCISLIFFSPCNLTQFTILMLSDRSFSGSVSSGIKRQDLLTCVSKYIKHCETCFCLLFFNLSSWIQHLLSACLQSGLCRCLLIVWGSLN